MPLPLSMPASVKLSCVTLLCPEPWAETGCGKLPCSDPQAEPWAFESGGCGKMPVHKPSYGNDISS